MNNFRALLISSFATYELAIPRIPGIPIRPRGIAPGMQAVTLQLMRCQNKIGDYYAAIAAFNGLRRPRRTSLPSFMRNSRRLFRLGRFGRRPSMAYRNALSTDRHADRRLAQFAGALCKFRSGRRSAQAREGARSGDPTATAIACNCFGLDVLKRETWTGASTCIRKVPFTGEGRSSTFLGWPVPGRDPPRLTEQLELLQAARQAH